MNVSLEEISTQNRPPKKNNKIIFINLGGRKEKLFFWFIFSTYFRVFYSNFNRDSSLDAKLNSSSNEYPLDILLMDPSTAKTINT